MKQHDFELVEEGSWSDIVSFCAQLSDVLKEKVSAEKHERFDSWRPKPAESKQQLRKKTAEEESIKTTHIEEKSEGSVKEMRNAGGEMRKSGKDMVTGHPRESLKDVGGASNSAARSVFPPILRFFRRIEQILYVNVIGKTSPNYFECSEFTVALERELLDRDKYRIRAVFEDEQVLQNVASTLEDD